MTVAEGPQPVSLIIASRHRPRLLHRALMAVTQQDHPDLEVVVVADPGAAAEIAAAGWPVKLRAFDEANLSAARNLGLALAAAPVVAFLDDDAVPEPSWLSRLAAPFAEKGTVAAGGFVRGRSGLAWQWRAMEVDRFGADHPMDVPARTSLHAGNRARAVKTQGTNCAFRSEALRAIGGFDPALRFYLDDADVNLRLAAAGGLTAVVPDAVVHHGFAESERRRADRVPRDLLEIGRSLAVFLRRHAGGLAVEAVAAQRASERRRALGHMLAGRIEPREVARLLAGFEAGIAEGASLPLQVLPPLAAEPTAFLRFPGTGPSAGAVVAGTRRDRARLEREAAALRADGRVVTLIELSAGFRAHRLEFGADGIWRQRGGRWGQGDRDLPRPWLGTAARVEREVSLLATIRPVA